MKYYIPYQPIDLPVLATCVRSMLQYAQPTPTSIEVIGPALPRKLAGELKKMNVGWIDEDTVFPGLTRRQMPEIPFRGSDLGGRLFSELLGVGISLERDEPRYAVVRPALVFVRSVSFAEANCSVLPLEGTTNVYSAQTASKLIGWADPQRAFSKYAMVFDRALVMQMISEINSRVPGKRFDEAIMDSLDLNNPAFSMHDTYGWFSVRTAGRLLKFRQASTLQLPRDMIDQHQAAANLALTRGCDSIYYQPGWLREVDAFLDQAQKFVDLAEVSVMLDAGSRDGEVALSAKRRLPRARVFSFECNPDAIELCRSNLRRIADIQLVENAVSDKSGPVTFYAIDPLESVTPHLDGNIGASSLFRADHAYPYEKYAQREVTVQAITLKEWADKEGIAAVDLLWMDLQGAELAALRGMGDLLKTVKVIYTEVEYKQMYQGQPTHEQLAEFMKASGFRLQHRTNTSEWFGNELYVRADLPERPAPPPAPTGTAVRVIGKTQTGGQIVSFEKR